VQRRRFKAKQKGGSDARRGADEPCSPTPASACTATGRCSRRRTDPLKRFEFEDLRRRCGRDERGAHCYVCSSLPQLHPAYDQLCLPCAGSTSRPAATAGPRRGADGVARRSATGWDRCPRGPPDHDAAALGRSLRAGGRFADWEKRLEISARSAPRQRLRFATTCLDPTARLHQQRLRKPSGGRRVLPPHARLERAAEFSSSPRQASQPTTGSPRCSPVRIFRARRRARRAMRRRGSRYF
jgi:hypothetical protein